jgi:apolipoprotein N-acyltransferase
MFPIFSLLLGALYALSFSASLNVAPWASALLNISVLSVFFWMLQARPNKATLNTAIFSLAWFSLGLFWLYISMHRYGAMPSAMAAAAVILFAGYLGSFYVLATFFAKRFSMRNSPTLNLWLLAGCWVLADLLRGYLFSGFPWLAIGYGQIDSPLAGLATYIGVYGVGLSALLVAASCCYFAKSNWAKGVLVSLITVTVLANAIAPIEAQHSPTKLRVALIQGNIAQEMKFDRNRILGTMEKYAAEIEKAEADLIVLPETAWTVPWSSTPETVQQRIANKARISAVVTGLPHLDEKIIANSVGAIKADGSVGYRYDKHHLVPFGEFIPWGFGWFVKMMSIPLGNFDRGSLSQPNLKVGAEEIAFNICYEDLFGEEIIESVRNGATILINISNLAWFGDSHALHQHLQIARMRAIETFRPMLRATNTGTTAVIDGRGTVQSRLPTFVSQTLTESIHGNTFKTFYVRWGNVPVLLLATALLILNLRPRPAVKIKK